MCAFMQVGISGQVMQVMQRCVCVSRVAWAENMHSHLSAALIHGSF